MVGSRGERELGYQGLAINLGHGPSLGSRRDADEQDTGCLDLFRRRYIYVVQFLGHLALLRIEH